MLYYIFTLYVITKIYAEAFQNIFKFLLNILLLFKIAAY